MNKPSLFKAKELHHDNSLVSIITFGPGVGESIVLYLPGLGWGVIDSCRIKIKKASYNPALEYLKSLNVKKLAFLVLTHPHLDHFEGLESIIDHYMGNIDRICVYAGKGYREYKAYLARKHLVNEPGIKSFASIVEKINKAKHKDANIVQISERTQIIRRNNYNNHEIEMIALSPSEESITKYCQLLYGLIPTDNQSPIKNISDKDHNLISSAIWCKIDNLVMIFGSDLEKGSSKYSGWRGVLNNRDCPDLSSSYVKIPHHGSPNAYSTQIWQSFSNSNNVISVVTPYNRSGSPRPDQKVLEKISEHSDSIYITSLAKFEDPKKFYKEIPFETSYGINSWDYIKQPQQVGYVKVSFSTSDNHDNKVFLKKPAYKFKKTG
ncbi:hypothetical protein DSCO28_40460 [Desulfosarcina ovata subsp. sediminis]|uniref:Metallo-beta-lactamase domain-containing protein n=1 Tax=Desulfosarcina ovata subsp. sediminis TaxID=885957 RepID=A0A5K7ZTF7_9BACT|nr:hypothetical protein [Desulfosarcina ovata]BBO83480.1 hypothetical protein DSCO28_40460 [Desulfosarcina ovata subsp. sediminis]